MRLKKVNTDLSDGIPWLLENEETYFSVVNFAQATSSLASGRNDFDQRCTMDISFLDDQNCDEYIADIQKGGGMVRQAMDDQYLCASKVGLD
jgi:hypothetical protein